MHRWIVLLIIGCLSLPLVAHAASLDGRIATIEAAYREAHDLQADFTQSTYVKTLRKHLKNHGVLYLKKPGKLRIEFRGSPKKHYISNGKKLWIYTPGDKQVQTQTLGKGIPKEALAFLNGFGDLRKEFTVTVGKKMTLQLHPKKKSGFQRLDCTFNNDGLLTAMTVHNSSGGTAQYRFRGITTNQGLAESFFLGPKK